MHETHLYSEIASVINDKITDLIHEYLAEYEIEVNLDIDELINRMDNSHLIELIEEHIEEENWRARLNEEELLREQNEYEEEAWLAEQNKYEEVDQNTSKTNTPLDSFRQNLPASVSIKDEVDEIFEKGIPKY